ncbi:MAG: hypothetical protein Kow0031_31710 [Anaerolineae bacterium]
MNQEKQLDDFCQAVAHLLRRLLANDEIAETEPADGDEQENEAGAGAGSRK